MGQFPLDGFRKKNYPGEDGRKALAVALSAYRSLEKGDTVYVDYG